MGTPTSLADSSLHSSSTFWAIRCCWSGFWPSSSGRTGAPGCLAKTLNAISTTVHNVATGLALVLLARSMSQGALPVGDLSLFVFYLEMTQMFGGQIGDLLTTYRRVGVSINRLLDLMPGAAGKALVEPTPGYLFGRLPEMPVPESVAEHRLEVLDVQGLTYTYPDSDAGIRDVSFSLRRGEFTVATGRIGSGKTTLLQTLIGWLPPQSGTVRWNGVAIDQPDDFLVPPLCGYMSQVPRLFSETLRSNILMGLPKEHVDLLNAVSSAVLDHDVEELVAGLDTMVGPRGVKLSEGQQRRAGAARMFVRDPELLVLDDLSSGLDVETEQTPCGSGCLHARTQRPWWSLTGAQPSGEPTASSS